MAVGRGHVGILRALLEHVGNAEVQTIVDTTPLHIAAQLNNVEAIDVLVEHGANIEAESDHTALPLHCAAMYTNLEAVVALLRHGANVNATDECGTTPLHDATSKAGRRGAAEIVDVLLRSGADEKIKDESRDPPLDNLRSRSAAAKRDRLDGLPERDWLDDDFERVHRLLANAPADRAWRRRGYLIFCRDRLERAQLANTEANGRSMEPSFGNVPTLDERDCDEKLGIIPKVVGLQEDGIFQTIVGFL